MPSSTSKLKATLTRKVGPAPVWAWVLAAVLAYMAYRAYQGSGAAAGTGAVSTGSPSQQVPASGSSVGASGAGSSADNLPADLLQALQPSTKDSYNTYAPSQVYTYAPTSSIDYGSGNTFPPSGGTAPGTAPNGVPGPASYGPTAPTPLPSIYGQPPVTYSDVLAGNEHFAGWVPPIAAGFTDRSFVPDRFAPPPIASSVGGIPSPAQGFTTFTAGGVAVGHGPVVG